MPRSSLPPRRRPGQRSPSRRHSGSSSGRVACADHGGSGQAAGAGNAGANTGGDHITVLSDVLAQPAGSSAAKILFRGTGPVPRTGCWNTSKRRAPCGAGLGIQSAGRSPKPTSRPTRDRTVQKTSVHQKAASRKATSSRTDRAEHPLRLARACGCAYAGCSGYRPRRDYDSRTPVRRPRPECACCDGNRPQSQMPGQGAVLGEISRYARAPK